MGRTTFGRSPFQAAAPVCGSTLVNDHLITLQFPAADANAAPHNPPMRAWLELVGNPNHHVKRFQKIPPSIAARLVSDVTYAVSISPAPTVFATASPESAPTKLKTAANRTAMRGVKTRVETTVAMELAASWKPLM